VSEAKMPTLAEWLAGYRSRPKPIEVVLYRVSLAAPIPSPVPGRSNIASFRISRFDAPRNPVPTGGFYVFHEDAAGGWVDDSWHEELDDAFDWAERAFGVRRADWQAVADPAT
jgi:hypothetical protein